MRGQTNSMELNGKLSRPQKPRDQSLCSDPAKHKSMENQKNNGSPPEINGNLGGALFLEFREGRPCQNELIVKDFGRRGLAGIKNLDMRSVLASAGVRRRTAVTRKMIFNDPRLHPPPRTEPGRNKKVFLSPRPAAGHRPRLKRYACRDF